MAGVLAGLVVVMAATAGGVTAALWALPGAGPLVTAAAALYFVWLAWRIANAPPLGDTTARRRPPTFAAGLLLSLVNPKGYAAMAALFSGFALVAASPVVDGLLKAAILLAIITAVDIAWLAAGAALTRHFRVPRTNRAINIGFAVLLVVSVAATLLV
jgi:threonine/homoserine/homoserine lactone efflux protein